MTTTQPPSRFSLAKFGPMHSHDITSNALTWVSKVRALESTLELQQCGQIEE